MPGPRPSSSATRSSTRGRGRCSRRRPISRPTSSPIIRTGSERMDYQALLDGVLSDVHAYRGSGEVASYVPLLAQADPGKFGIALALPDGSTYVAGDGD